jgi:hypothetical protein
MTVRRVWRLGFRGSPYEFVPRRHCSWNQRFDDVDREYRTLYCAEKKLTCLREVLADLRPNTAAIDDFNTVFSTPGDGLVVAGVVSSAWRRSHVLAEGAVACEGRDIVDLEAPSELQSLERQHAGLLKKHKMPHLTISALRSKNREVTQTISRGLFNNGAAGIRFRSNLDNGICYALFEGRAKMKPIGRPIPMSDNGDELVNVAGEYTLVLRPAK